MAVNIFDKYGIKEVANVYFEALEDETKNGVYKGDIVLYLDTLKVSTIETTAENVAAQGGWGNPRLIQWDYGKEITVTLEDALLSLESLRFMFGGAIKQTRKKEEVIVRHTEEVVVEDDGTGKPVFKAPEHHQYGEVVYPTATYGHPIKMINLGGGQNSKTAGGRTQIRASKGEKIKLLSEDNEVVFKNPALLGSESTVEIGDHIRIFWDQILDGQSGDNHDNQFDAVEVTISPNTFPGTYRVVGDTFMRSEKTGADEAFQFVIEKAKVSSEVTLTLEAEGDPATFEMTLNVLRSSGKDGNEMMKLIRYNVDSNSGDAENDWGRLNSSGASDASEEEQEQG